jgi:hypothetical protein
MDIITEVKASMTKLLENKMVDLEFNLNNRIVELLILIFIDNSHRKHGEEFGDSFEDSLEFGKPLHY